LLCGPDLLATLIQDGLVDECQILVTPMALGQGLALFGKLQGKVDFNLLGTQTFASGSVLHHYQLQHP
jgi:dihydrofolate reductase